MQKPTSGSTSWVFLQVSLHWGHWSGLSCWPLVQDPIGAEPTWQQVGVGPARACLLWRRINAASWRKHTCRVSSGSVSTCAVTSSDRRVHLEALRWTRETLYLQLCGRQRLWKQQDRNHLWPAGLQTQRSANAAFWAEQQPQRERGKIWIGN